MRKGEDGSPDQLKAYALTVVKSDVPGALRNEFVGVIGRPLFMGWWVRRVFGSLCVVGLLTIARSRPNSCRTHL